MTDTRSVREQLRREMEAEEIHGITVTHRQDETVYLIVSRSTTWEDLDECADRDIPVVDVRTVVVDFETDSVRVSDNGLWIPRDGDVSRSITRLMARTSNDLDGERHPYSDPLQESTVEGTEPELVLDRQIEITDDVEEQHTDKMRNHGGIDPARNWGYGSGPPEEIEHVAERLREAGLKPSEHVTRLVWGKKEPMDRVPRPVEELTGNYGIELLPRDSGLIALDVDYPEHFPDSELPETLEVSSPHGDDEQRHIILRCDSKEELADDLGAWAIQGVDWGDLWVGDRYVVGPGSQLSEYGCDHAEHDRGDSGGCDRCEDPDGGYYEILVDEPIATVSPDEIRTLIRDSSSYDLRDGPADPDPPASDDHDQDTTEQGDDTIRCDNCQERRAEIQLKAIEIGDETRHICRGGCE